MDRSARLTVPMAHELCSLLNTTCDQAAIEQPDLVPNLLEMRHCVEQSIRLIDGRFNKWMVKAQMQNMIDLLEDTV